MALDFDARLTALERFIRNKVAVLAAPFPRVVLFGSVSDGKSRARVITATSENFAGAWETLRGRLRDLPLSRKAIWLKVDWVTSAQTRNWGQLARRLEKTKRNYFRLGLSLDRDFRFAFLEQEINANAMLYGGNTIANAVVNPGNFRLYARTKFPELPEVQFDPDGQVTVFATAGAFSDETGALFDINGSGPDGGRRHIAQLRADDVTGLIRRSSSYLAEQVQPEGRFIYGYHPCFDRRIEAYNTLRHASTTYAMIEAWEVTRDPALKAAIDRSLAYLTGELIHEAVLADGTAAAFLVDTGNEIKLGGNAVAILALTKYAAVTGSRDLLPLAEKLAHGIRLIQDEESGAFVHVLNWPDLSIKARERVIYYDGEAAFGLMRLYEATRNPLWLATVEKAFEHFIAAGHWQHHDHWLSYCVNELTRYRPEERYFRFGIQNFADYLDFVLERITTFPTLLELMMAAERMLGRIAERPDLQHLLDDVQLVKFHSALHRRAHHLLNGHFWPELAMYYRNPARISGSFFIRHHAFRVRIDDVEHYLSGFVAYREFLLRREGLTPQSTTPWTVFPVSPTALPNAPAL